MLYSAVVDSDSGIVVGNIDVVDEDLSTGGWENTVAYVVDIRNLIVYNK